MTRARARARLKRREEERQEGKKKGLFFKSVKSNHQKDHVLFGPAPAALGLSATPLASAL